MNRLMPRHIHGNTRCREIRRKALAHQTLDRAQAGHDIARADITEALRVTGDLMGGRGAHVSAAERAFAEGVQV